MRFKEASSSFLKKRTKKLLSVAGGAILAHLVCLLDAIGKSFLLLFFKKEVLLLTLTSANRTIAVHVNNTLLEGQVAIITGGGGGIGRGIALAYASVGADIVIGDIIPERCDEVVARVCEMGRQALAVPTDVMDTSQIRTLVELSSQRFGRIDILVNNAGGVTHRPFVEQSERSWRRHIDLNLVSMFAATSAAVPIMIAGGRGGSIINVTSIEGSRAAPGYAVYGACKAGMINFTRTMAVELADQAIRVNAIAPDITTTPGTRGNHKGPVDPASWVKLSPERAYATARRVPLGREGLDEECGNVAVFLSSAMSSYVTGAVIPVDGGTWASGGWVRNRNGKWVLVEDLPVDG
jgi:NAD(P)-dependent dehydrogenase (short-subunit alcohol dehydrogenase family)